jgi:hypothetical protein
VARAALLLVLCLPGAARPQEQPQATATQPARVGAADGASLVRGDDAVVITVGDVALRRSDVFRQLDLAAPARSAEVIRQMVLTTAAEMDARREGLDVPAEQLDKEVEAAIAEQRASFALEVDEKLPLEEYLRLRHGLTPEEHRAEVRRMVLASLLLERAVRLDQLRTGYDVVQLIVVPDEPLAQDIAGQLREGASFAVLARRHSVHPSAAHGGDLPAVPLGADSALVAGRESLGPGGLLGPVALVAADKTLWRLLRLVDRVPPTDASWSDLRDRVEAELAARPLEADELAVFEARVVDRYRVSRPARSP